MGILNYGEHDTINILFVGSAAQSWYNQEYNTIQTLTSWSGTVSDFIDHLYCNWILFEELWKQFFNLRRYGHIELR